MKIHLPSWFVQVKNIFPTHLASWSIFLLALGALGLSGCIYYGPPPRRRAVIVEPAPVVVEGGAYPIGSEIVVDAAPPVALEEAVPVSPGVAYVWIPGVWIWQGRWVWSHGYWALPPHPGAVWVPYRYEYRNGVHVFIRGGWR